MDDYLLMTDISHHQGDNINFKKMKAMGVDVCYMKRSEGNYFKDPCFDYNWKACQDADIIPGPYHFAVPYNPYTYKRLTGLDNLSYFFDVLGGLVAEVTVPFGLDAEEGYGQPAAYTTTVMQYCINNLNKSLTYTGDWWWSSNILPWSGWNKSDLWVMSVPYYDPKEKTHFPNHELFFEWLNRKTRFPIIPRATDKKPSWDDWLIWQFSHQGKGTDYGLERGAIDLDIARPALLTGVTPPPPEPPPVDQVAANLVVTFGSDSYSGQVNLTKI